MRGFLPTEEWEPYLANMPDRALAGVCRWASGSVLAERTSLRGARGNLPSVEVNLAAVREYIEEELKQSTIRPALPEELGSYQPDWPYP